jgi:CBS domain-containing protein
VKVSEIMSRGVVTVAPEDGVKAAAYLLVDRGISALPVIDKKGRLVGIVSEADLLPIENRPDPRSQATPLLPTAGSAPRTVAEVMTREVVVVTAGTEVSRAARIMLEGSIKRLPVMRGQRLVGIVSRRDLVKVIARRDQDIEREVTRKLHELGIGSSPGAISVLNGVATLAAPAANRRLAESVALTVPGVLEVTFRTVQSRGGEPGMPPQAPVKDH